MNFKGEAYQPENRTYVAAMLGGEIAFGETSKLYKKLVLDEQRVDRSSSASTRPATASGRLSAGQGSLDVRPSSRRSGTRSPSCARTRRQKRLDAVRSNMRYGFLRSLSTAAETAGSLARIVALTGDVSSVNPFFATLAAVTPDDVRKAANTWLLPERSTVAILHTKGVEVPLVSAKNASAPTPAAPEAAETSETTSPATATAAAAPAGRIVQAPVLLPVESDPEVSFRLWFQVGSQDDPAGKEGLAALTAEMISDGGTERLTTRSSSSSSPSRRATHASVDKEMTVVSGSVHEDSVEEYTELLVDAITRPGFRKEDFERLRDQAVSGIENVLRFSSDEELGKATLNARVRGDALRPPRLGHRRVAEVDHARGRERSTRRTTRATTSCSGSAAASRRDCPSGSRASPADCPRAGPSARPRRSLPRSRGGT